MFAYLLRFPAWSRSRAWDSAMHRGEPWHYLPAAVVVAAEDETYNHNNIITLCLCVWILCVFTHARENRACEPSQLPPLPLQYTCTYVPGTSYKLCRSSSAALIQATAAAAERCGLSLSLGGKIHMLALVLLHNTGTLL